MEYRILNEQNKKIILFNDEKYIGLQELLNTIDLYHITLDDVLSKIKLVSDGLSELEKIGSEKAMIEISHKRVEIYDLFEGIVDDEELFPTIYVSLEEFNSVINDFKKNDIV